MTKKIISQLKIFFIVVAILIVSRILVCIIPSDIIVLQQAELAETLQYRGVLPTINFGGYGIKVDFWTESYYINNACTVDNRHPIRSAFSNTVVGQGKDPLERVIYAINGEEDVVLVERPQYWWGAMCIIRPILSVMDYESALTIWQIFETAILIIFMVNLYQRLPKKYFFAVLFGILNINIMSAMMIFHTGIVWVIALLCGIALMKKNIREKSVTLFMVSGCLTAYFDWMSTPIVTFLIPFLILMGIYFEEEKGVSIYEGARMLFCNGISWALAYGSMQLIRWALSSAILKENVFLAGKARVIEHETMGEETSVLGQLLEDIRLCTQQFSMNAVFRNEWLQMYWLILFMGMAFVFAGIIYIFMRKNVEGLMLSILSFCPVIWITVFRGWFSIHYWFSYRILGMSFIFSLLSVVYTILECRKKCKYF